MPSSFIGVVERYGSACTAASPVDLVLLNRYAHGEGATA